MKKIFTIICLTALLTPSFVLAAPVKATLINDQGDKVVVTSGSAMARHYFSLGFYLMGKQDRALGISIPTVVALFETSLATKISSTASSMTLINATNMSGNPLNGFYGFIIDEGSSIQEFVTGTASGTAVTGLVRGIDVVDGKTSVTALKFEHRRGASVKITNFPQLAIISRILNGDESTPGGLTFGAGYINGLTITPNSSATSSVANVEYVNNVATSGAANLSETVKGVGQAATTAQLATSSKSVGSTGAILLVQAKDVSSTPTTSDQFASLSGGVAVVGKFATAEYRLAQSFKTDRAGNVSVDVMNKGIQNGIGIYGGMIVELASNNAGVPGSVLASTTIASSTWNGYATGTTVNIALNYAISANTTYWIVFRDSNPTSANQSSLAYDLNNIYTNGNLSVSINGGSNWTPYLYSLFFRIYTAGNVIPLTASSGMIPPSFYQGNDNNWTGTNTLSGTGIGYSTFGSDGSDGALNISSGTTTVNLASSTIYVKNYSSINITGTGALAFSGQSASGTTIILRSQGDCNITSTANPAIDLRGLGGKGGDAVTFGGTANGNDGVMSTYYFDAVNHYGAKGLGDSSSGAGGLAVTNRMYYGASTNTMAMTLFRNLVPGSGGASGGGNGGTSGAGGRGAGALYIECNGRLNFTGTILATGGAGGDGTTASGGGGGGAGGMVLMLYNRLTSSAGTITVTGGNGGNGVNGNGGGHSSGGGGGALLAPGGAGATSNNTGSSGSNDTGNGGTGGTISGGGGGAGGVYLITKNLYF